jgi:adenylate cyclase
MRLTISKKLNIFIVLSLLTSIVAVVYISTSYFTSDLVDLLRKDTLDTASIVAGRVRSEMRQVAERARLLAAISLQDFKTEQAKVDFLQKNFALERDIFAIAILKRQKIVGVTGGPVMVAVPGPFVPYWRQVNPTIQKMKNFVSADFDSLDRSYPLAYDSVAKGLVEFEVAKLPGGTSVLRVGLPFIQEGEGEFTEILVVDLRNDLLTSLFSESTSYINYLIDRKGTVIGSSDPLKVNPGANLEALGITDEIKLHKDEFVDVSGERQILGSQKVGFADLMTISQVSYAKAKRAKKDLLVMASFLGGAILFLALAVGFLFSQTLTTPITKLANAAGQIEKGNFNVSLFKPGEKRKINGDEIQQLSFTFDQMVLGLRERDKVKTALSTYHSKELVDKVLSGELQIGGERKEAAVLFTDIRGFTTLSEKMDPALLFQTLNEYLGVMVNVILKYGGHIDKFMGDGILAVWGVPTANMEDADRAIQCCLAMREALKELNIKFIEKGFQEFHIGMGLHFGPVIAGNIGSNERMEYTILGDTVNTASRIETLTKLVGIDLLVSDSALKNSSGKYSVEDSSGHKVKGRSQTVRVFKILESVSELSRGNVAILLERISHESSVDEIQDSVEVLLSKNVS